MGILFIGKRFYTNRDAYSERFGRIYQLPFNWSKETPTSLWLIDYHTTEKIKDQHDLLDISATPVLSLFFFVSIIKTIFIKKPKTIVASGDCYIGIFVYFLAKLCKAKFVFDVYDKYDSFNGYRNLGFKNLYLFLLRNADICFFASKKLKEDSESNCKRVLLIPNGVDKEQFFPRDKIKSREHFKLSKDKFYVGYFGSMEVERGIDDLISAVEILQKKNININLLLAGKKRDDLNINKRYICYLGNVAFKDIPIAMACCDILTLPYRSSLFLDNASSCKINEYIEMEIPIVATKSKNNLTTINSTSNPNIMFCEMNNIDQLAYYIVKQLNNKSRNYKKDEASSWKIISRIFLDSSL